MIDFIRPYISRLVASGVAALAGWLLIKINVILGPEDQVALTEAGVVVVLAILQPVYAIVHKFLDRWINPGDDADPALVKASAAHARAIRRGGNGGSLPPAASSGDYVSRR